MATNIEWFKCKKVGWCDLFKVDIEHELVSEIEGIYICWTGSGMDDSLSVIKVGEGYIHDIIIDLRSDLEIKAFRNKGVFITWCEIPSYKSSGILKYLEKELKPLFTSEKIAAIPRKVNIPWDQDEIDGFKQQVGQLSDDSDSKEAKLPWQ